MRMTPVVLLVPLACGDVGTEAMGGDTAGTDSSSATLGTSFTVGGTDTSTSTSTATGESGTSSSESAGTTSGVDASTSDASTSDASTSDGSSSSSAGSTDTGSQVCHPILAEIAYRVAGGDGNREWVKLYNPCDEAIDLSAYSLGYGGNDYASGTHPLSGMIEPDTCLLFGGPDSIAQNWLPILDVAQDINPDLQDGGADADAIGLFALPDDMIEASSIPVDAVVYGDANTNAFVDPEGAAVPPHTGTGDDLHTLYRDAIMPPQWSLQVVPAPNGCQF